MKNKMSKKNFRNLLILFGIFVVILGGELPISKFNSIIILLYTVLTLISYKVNLNKFEKKEKKTIYIYICWIIFLFINTVFSFDKKISLHILIFFVLSYCLYFINFEEFEIYKILKLGRIICLFWAISICLEVVLPNLIISIAKIIEPERISIMQNELRQGIYSGLVGEKGLAAYIMVFGTCIEIALYVAQENKFYKSNYIIILLYFLATMLTGKRMLSLILIIEVMIAIHFFKIKGKSAKVFFGAIVFGVMFVIILFIIPQTTNLINRFILVKDDTSSGGRKIFWDFCIKMYNDKPVIGYGINTFNEVFADQVAYKFNGQLWNMYAHNIYYELLGETGIIGTTLFIYMLLHILISSLKLFKNNVLSFKWKGILWFSISLQILFITYGVTGNVLYTTPTLICYIFSIMIYLSASRNNKIDKIKKEEI